MSIRDRLRLSYGAMFVIPIVLSLIAAIFISKAYIHEIEKNYNIQISQRPLGDFMVEEPLLLEKVKGFSEGELGQLAEWNYLSNLDEELSQMNAGILIRRENQIFYKSDLIRDFDIEGKLPSFGDFQEEKHKKLMLEGNPYLLRQLDFLYDDGAAGSMFLVVDLSFVAKSSRSFIITLLIVILVIITLTNGILTLSVSHSILNPLKKLEDATKEIKEGNLDFEIDCHSRDEIGQLCHAFEDMRSKLKESIEIQLQYERNRNELMSNISHDLKTPVTAIKGYVEGIMDGVADSPEKQQRYIKTIHNKAKDMDRLIDELLLYSKLDIKKLPFHFEGVDILQFLQDIIEEYQFDLEEKNITLKLQHHEGDFKEMPLILADREKLKRVIGNIVDNAVKYMKKDIGKIDILLSNTPEEEASIQVEIQDNGQGIPKEHLPFIFDRFYRVDPSRNSATGGSGLGLAIAKRIIQEHGGRIWGESQLNRGTSIFFTLRKFTEDDRGEDYEENLNC
ncbi:sensor histidine kinase [Alkaliphilus hydrothermalis]|uniref:histidine kinase n=1 Tax=Alkaliphilus hydrothermalis TaxID=1482730 RepID=A0ABS2NT28_9FIRM|nr:signal transduction histidine kinase [Alkaliphilus hydrothermalis]